MSEGGVIDAIDRDLGAPSADNANAVGPIEDAVGKSTTVKDPEYNFIITDEYGNQRSCTLGVNYPMAKTLYEFAKMVGKPLHSFDFYFDNGRLSSIILLPR